MEKSALPGSMLQCLPQQNFPVAHSDLLNQDTASNHGSTAAEEEEADQDDAVLGQQQGGHALSTHGKWVSLPFKWILLLALVVFTLLPAGAMWYVMYGMIQANVNCSFSVGQDAVNV
jgi:hypothetical protein